MHGRLTGTHQSSEVSSVAYITVKKRPRCGSMTALAASSVSHAPQGGDVIKLTADLLGLTPVEALRRLNADFNMRLDLDKPPDRVQVRKAQELREAAETFEAWKERALLTLGTYHRELWQAKERPVKSDGLDPLQVEAYKEIDKVSYYLDCLEDDPMGFYKTNREYVAKISQRLEGMKASENLLGERSETLYGNRKSRPCNEHERLRENA